MWMIVLWGMRWLDWWLGGRGGRGGCSGEICGDCVGGWVFGDEMEESWPALMNVVT